MDVDDDKKATDSLCRCQHSLSGDGDDDDESDDSVSPHQESDDEDERLILEDGRLRGCLNMVIYDDMTLDSFEKVGFKAFCHKLCPDFVPPCEEMVAKHIYELYSKEKKALKSVFSKNPSRVCLTTDTWISINNRAYLVVTAHFIDNGWQLRKRILKFDLTDHSAETTGEIIHSCLIDWGIGRVFTLTIDNPDVSDVTINYVKKKLESRSAIVLNGDFLHMQCYAGIINSIVSEVLKDMHDTIVKIRNAIRYIRLTGEILRNFKRFADLENIHYKVLVSLDVPTRWDSTYLMLADAVKFRKAFEQLEANDEHYTNHFLNCDDEQLILGMPKICDWENAEVVVQVFKIFYGVTLKFSSLSVTSNIYLGELCSVRSELREMCKSRDPLLSKMATSISGKYDKSLGSFDNSKLLLIAIVLDPCCKLHFINFCFKEIYDATTIEEMVKGVNELLLQLFELYSSVDSSSAGVVAESDIPSNALNIRSGHHMSRFKEFLKEQVASLPRNEVDRYLSEPLYDDDKFDLLHWWRLNSTRYPILSQIARDVLAVPITTALSETAFTIGGRVLNEYRSSLEPKMLEALACLKNWLRSSYIWVDAIPTDEDIEFADEDYLGEA